MEEESKGSNGDDKPVTLEPIAANSNPILSIAKKIGLRTLAWVGVYLLGYFDFSIAWMVTPLLLSVLRDHWKKEKRNRLAAAREAALSNEQAMLEARMNTEDLPSWVFFPDKERAEWMNSILKQVWPYVNEYVRNTLFNVVEPAVESALKGFKMTPFKFDRDRVFLGQVPPRITGIKVYDTNISRKEIIIDVDIVFASDAEIVFKVKGIKAKVSDFGLRGMARIVLKPLINQIPLIGGVQVYFLKAPEIDYSLGGVAGALEIPGLNKIVEKIIVDQIKNFIVLPNKFSMPLVESIPKKSLKCPDSAGVLRVKLLRAANLVDKDGIGSGVSDPYAILTVGAHTHRVKTIRDSCNPVWEKDNVFDFPIEVVSGQELLVEFYDDDDRKDDEFLGRAKIQTSVVADRGHIESRWIDLVDCDQGKVQLSLSWLKVTDDKEYVKTITKVPGQEDHSKGLVHIYVDSCKGLISPRDPSSKPSPRVRILCSHGRVQQSWPTYNTNDPIIEQGFVCLVKSPNFDVIEVEVIDHDKKDRVLGKCSINVSSLIKVPDMEFSLQPWTLKSECPNAQIFMSVSLRGLLPPQSSPLKRPSSKSPESPAGRRDSLLSSSLSGDDMGLKFTSGRVKLMVHRAEQLEKKDVSGKSDPYVVITYQDQRQETKVCKKTLEPVWDEKFWFDIHADGDNQIVMQVFDKDKMRNDEKMGRLSIDVRKISEQKKMIDIWDSLDSCKSGRLLWSAEFVEAEDSENVPEPEVEETINSESDVKGDEPAEVQEAVVIENDDESGENIVEVENTDTQEDIIEETPIVDQEESIEVKTPDNEDNNLGYMTRVQAGILEVTVHKAEHLISKDFGGKSDPYVKIKYNGLKKKSNHIKKDLNPVFDFKADYEVQEDGASDVLIEVVDHDIGKNESLGTCFLDLRQILSDGNIDHEWRDLNGVDHGRILLSVIYNVGNNGAIIADDATEDVIEVTKGNDDVLVDNNELRQRNISEYGRVRLNLLYDENREELKLFLHEAENLPGGDLPDPPDPYCKIYLMPGKKKKKKTEVFKDSVNPEFNEEFDFSVDIKDLKKYFLKIFVMDKKGVFSKSPVLGAVEIRLDNPGIENGIAGWFPLEKVEDDSD